MTEDIIKKIPWKKITAPMLPLILADIYLGKFLKDVHSINLAHGLLDKVPTDRTFYIFIVANLFIMSIYLIVSALGVIRQEKINKLKSQMELSAVEKQIQKV